MSFMEVFHGILMDFKGVWHGFTVFHGGWSNNTKDVNGTRRDTVPPCVVKRGGLLENPQTQWWLFSRENRWKKMRGFPANHGWWRRRVSTHAGIKKNYDPVYFHICSLQQWELGRTLTSKKRVLYSSMNHLYTCTHILMTNKTWEDLKMEHQWTQKS